ncbi:MAG: hypothetical protein DHS20C15_23020 [Planctomycetota bacterium]|nr:MAG: hypothetical protein DHS20C15_23020 [Planctomycetota bacterium]
MRWPCALLALALTLGACTSSPERWAVMNLERLSYSNLYQQVVDALDGSGYRVMKQDLSSGRIETDWQYGPSVREVRGPSRRRAIAELRPLEDGVHEVRVRVSEQVIRKGGTLARHIRESNDWEDWRDDYDEAEYLIARMGALLAEYRVRFDAHDGAASP